MIPAIRRADDAVQTLGFGKSLCETREFLVQRSWLVYKTLVGVVRPTVELCTIVFATRINSALFIEF